VTSASGTDLRAKMGVDFSQRVAWVTGASRGLGRAIAFGLAEMGAEVLLTARSEDGLADIAETIRGWGGVAEVVAGSVSDPAVVAEAVDFAERRWGKLDVLVNNAGVSPSFSRAEHVKESDWGHVLDVNLSAPFACCRAALPLLETPGSASVVNISSVLGTRAQERLIAYAASKGGLEMLTRTLAVEWAERGIRVNSIAPGYLESDLTAGLLDHPHWGEQLRSRIPMGRFGDVSEVVPAVLFLAGAGAGYITGATVYVDGGWTAT
jgi:NAD(P)-dependent dehydrogenase (short-subunit alcohol dehydrogenase family)